ncbi:unnamed protein product [Microthlaspi erraticum]|uniref:GRF-type domain-containing protein n=1 Tax=Microthlaspi erraticum TaxID=1685480 RepID=A0A6D2JMG0_9BRAS|nr:unnamed protein product [Microthlaspi erraticum]
MSTGSFVSAASVENHGVVCDCGLPSPVRRSWTRRNPDRRFHTCKGRRVENGYIDCGFFRWYNQGDPSGWQFLALLEAREMMEEQRMQIAALTNEVTTLSMNAENDVKSKELGNRCEALKRDVQVLTERCIGLQNVLIASTVGFGAVFGVMMLMWTSNTA